jgi:ABC-type sugar transport system ATPase subunit
LDVKKGEIHGIIGKNGAGKSVLMTLVAGISKATSGTMAVYGKQINMDSLNPAKALELGIVLIPQEPLIVPNLSVLDNLFLGKEYKTPLRLLDQNAMRQKTLEIAEKLSVNVSPQTKMGDLLIEEQQLMTFAKTLFINKAKIMLLDEITASLPKERKYSLLQLLRESIKKNPELSYTLITHHINEIIEFCDRVTVLRDGKIITTLNTSETNTSELSDYIIGENVSSISKNKNSEFISIKNYDQTSALLETRNLQLKNSFEGVNIKLFKGQVIGLAGLDGSGKHELLEALSGLTKPDSGEILVEESIKVFNKPYQALKNGIAYLPKKREKQAIIHNRSVAENTLLSIYDKLCNKLGWINFKKAIDIVEKSIKFFNVKTPSHRTNIDNLSGGNRQKVVMNRIYNTDSKIFLLNEPTRGVDLAVKPEILSVIRNELTKAGGVIFTSESEDELIETSDNILVFFKGKIFKEFQLGEENFVFPEVYKALQGVGSS